MQRKGDDGVCRVLLGALVKQMVPYLSPLPLLSVVAWRQQPIQPLQQILFLI